MIVVQFLVPIRNRAGDPYSRGVLKELQDDLEERFGGWSLAADRALPGAWRDPASGEIECDESWRYEVGIGRGRLDELDDYLSVLADRLSQKAIWRIVYGRGEAKAIPARTHE